MGHVILYLVLDLVLDHATLGTSLHDQSWYTLAMPPRVHRCRTVQAGR